MYYIQHGLGKKWKWLGVLFAIFGVFAVFGTGNATQVNTIVASIDTALISFGVVEAGSTSTLNLILGIVITILVGLILLGGIKRIGHVAERLVPIMALLYVVLGLGVIIVHIENLPAAFSAIVKGAFNPTAVTGGVVGAMFTAVQKGVARGIFSNEAGLGTASIAHAGAEVNDPVQQGLFGVFEVFVDTIIICTFTALVILCSGVPISFGAAAGAELTISGFTSTYGSWITIFTAVAMCCFAFTTILGWGLYGARCSEYRPPCSWSRSCAVIGERSLSTGHIHDLCGVEPYRVGRKMPASPFQPDGSAAAFSRQRKKHNHSDCRQIFRTDYPA